MATPPRFLARLAPRGACGQAGERPSGADDAETGGETRKLIGARFVRDVSNSIGR